MFNVFRPVSPTLFLVPSPYNSLFGATWLLRIKLQDEEPWPGYIDTRHNVSCVNKYPRTRLVARRRVFAPFHSPRTRR